MRFLLDMPVSLLLLDVLQSYGHEAVHAHQIGKDRTPDNELLEIARAESRVVITADLDFPRLMALSLAEGRTARVIQRKTDRMARCLSGKAVYTMSGKTTIWLHYVGSQPRTSFVIWGPELQINRGRTLHACHASS
ncbi:MAG TPA: DUF5615 family PIN-like protein [Sedimentisphaerales bacterium]|jgi:predicted nuclease of predicted toxin-antitoxin system|nr:DUF5615 family PIN-like protein [Sedimentisphaerales bacterium]HNU31293.1 DUF5615 family PIN-like protein [Sedimentisphaerales bacterium]